MDAQFNIRDASRGTVHVVSCENIMLWRVAFTYNLFCVRLTNQANGKEEIVYNYLIRHSPSCWSIADRLPSDIHRTHYPVNTGRLTNINPALLEAMAIEYQRVNKNPSDLSSGFQLKTFH